MTNTMEITPQVCEAVRRAAAILEGRPEQVIQKGNNSNYVTDADLRVQQSLEHDLTALIPGSVVLGEENKVWNHDSSYAWIVDPIDGTSNFIRDLGASCISVALMKGEELISGVIYNPYRNELFYGETGCGAWLNGTRIHVSDRDYAHSHLCAAMSLYDKRFAPQCFRSIERIYEHTDDLRRFGSAAMEVAQLAAGRVELYFEIRIAPWDVAAGALLIQEAGGVYECLYDKGMQADKMFPFIAANSPENFEQLRRIVTEELPVIPYPQNLVL